MTTPPAEKRSAIDLLKAFLAEHPELVPELAQAAAELASGPPTPLTIYHVVHDLVDMMRGGIDDERRAQMHASIDEHEAAHAELVAQAHVHNSAAPSPAAEAPSSPASPSSSLSIDGDPATFDPPGA